MSKHTPGPWRAIADPLHFGTISDVVGGETLPTSYTRNQMFVSVGGYCDVEEQEANARLIATAPELLSVLELYISMLESRGVTCVLGRKLIAKARGA